MIGAVDIGGTKVAAGVVDPSGRVLAKEETATAPLCQRGPAGFDGVKAMLHSVAKRSGTALSGIGISSTGPVDPFTGILNNRDFLPGWDGLNLVEELSREFGVPAAVENDADACALAESAWGAGRGKRRFLYLTVSTGIGGGFVLNGNLYRGAAGVHPEIGHIVVEACGPPCSCGSNGCWEAVAAGPAMAAWASQHVPAGYPQALDARILCAMAAAGDAFALRAVEREAFYLGVGLASVLTMLAPDAIALGGGVMRSWPLFDKHCRETIRRYCTFVSLDNTAIGPAALGPDVALIGAARVWLSRFPGPL